MSDKAQALRQIVGLAQEHGLSAEDISAALQSDGVSSNSQRSFGILSKVLAYLGAVFALAGMTIFIGMLWDDFNSATRVLVTLGVGFAIFLFALAATTDNRFGKAITPMFLIAALLQPTGIIVMLEEYARGGNPEHGLLFMCVVMLTQQFLTFRAKGVTVLLFTSLFFGAAGFGTLCEIMEIDFGITAVALGIGLTSVAFSIDRTTHRAIAPFWYFVGSTFVLYGAFDLLKDSALEIVYFAIPAAVMYLGVVVRSRTLLFSSVIALMSFTGWYFRDSLANAFGLMFMGFLLISLSALAMQLNRKFIQNRS